ncbi:MAG TPA: PDC sensor domain-containing protein [Thermoanaerobaculia bacterium]|nr:PDC sensor domain-containing protein [Thermoanaerobaculia bacterium]
MSNSRALLSLIAAMLCAAGMLAAPKKRDAAKLSEAAAHADVVAAVKTQNARALPLVAIKVIDQRWFLGKESNLVQQTITGKCADQLRAFVTANPAYGQAFVLDDQGAVVCASTRTENYWYAEAPLWQRAFRGETFLDRSLLSVPVRDEDRVIGAIAARVKLTS